MPHSVDSIHLFPSLVLFPLHPVLVEVVEQLVDVRSALGVSSPRLGIEFEQLNI